MIEIVFTLDYEIYGNGEGSLRELVIEPAERLTAIFRKWDARFVVFPEVAELEMIEAFGADPGIEPIKQQVRDLQKDGFELGLHFHPWWYNARRQKGTWAFDRNEYNLCSQTKERIDEIVDRSIAYLRKLAGVPDLAPISFRAGHLLLQPTQPLSAALAKRGIQIDSSVYKGGLWRQHNLDYRPAPRKDYFWRFMDDVTVPDPRGALLELPIYTRLVPTWRLFTSKRVSLQQKGASTTQTGKKILTRALDFLRFRYPLKFDLGQMTEDEMTHMMDRIIRDDKESSSKFRPIVVIMHTKDPLDLDAVNSLLDYLGKSRVRISTLSDVCRRIKTLDIRVDGK